MMVQVVGTTQDYDKRSVLTNEARRITINKIAEPGTN
jgi:hypothetical protein